jgi:hypothetical protein
MLRANRRHTSLDCHGADRATAQDATEPEGYRCNEERQTLGEQLMPKRKDIKRIEAEERKAEHDKLTTRQKLAKALGQRERARLQKRLERETCA